MAIPGGPPSGVDFFVSYTGADEAWASWVAAVLEAEGQTVAVQAWNAPAGESVIPWINRQMTAAARTVAICSRAYFASYWHTEEWAGALAGNTLIPLRVEDCQIPAVLSTISYQDLYSVDEVTARRRLLEATGLARPSRRQTVLPRGISSGGSGSNFPGKAAPASAQGLGPSLAAPHSDAPSETDALDVAADVRTLASLVSAKGTSPPLSIALLGDWGSGKSTFMLQMRRQVERLTDDSRAAGQESSYVSEVCQIDFNAWHYSDNQVWTGLVDRLFQTLKAKTQVTPQQVEYPNHAEAEADRLRADLESLRAGEQELTNDLERIDGRRSADGQFSTLAPITKLVDTARALAHETRRDLRSSRGPLFLLALVLAAGAAIWAATGPTVTSNLSTVLTVAIPAVTAAVAFGAPAWRTYRRLAGSADVQQKRLSSRRDAVRCQITELNEQLALVDATTALDAFLTDRSASVAYAGHRGLVSQVRDDLERLVENLTVARKEWTRRGQVGPPPLERIVLYIDDLDRCPPRRVVDVLAAVHLLLALPLFVVVVAVDTRWLIRSLRLHQHEMFAGQDKGATASLPADVVAAPLDYLDKIFQIPFALRPMGVRAQQYLANLLPPEEGSEHEEGWRGEAQADRSAVTAAGTDGSPQPPGTFATTARPAEDVRPASLQISAAERNFLPLLHSFLSTPRAGKKFVNLYRLTRISVEPDELPAFLGDSEKGGSYQVVAILLAILVGRAGQAHALFRELQKGAQDEKLPDFLRAEPGERSFAESWFNLTDLRLEVASAIDELSGNTPVLTTLGEYQRWGARIARFSFSGGDLGG